MQPKSNTTFPETWTAPPELTGPLPRHVQPPSGMLFPALVLLSCSGVLLWGLYRAAGEYAASVALRHGSQETTGVVTFSTWRGATRVSYRFTVNGATFSGSSSATIHHQADLKKGDRLPIRFLPSNPAINRPAEWEGPEGDWWLGCAFSGLLVAVFLWGLLSTRRYLQVQAEGLPAAGTVISCLSSGRQSWEAKYQFRAGGQLLEGSGSLAELLEPGATICVLYLPQSPRRNLVYQPRS